MQKDSLELALNKVEENEPEGDDLGQREGGWGVRAKKGGWVDVWPKGVSDEESDEYGASIFDDVDGAPGDLRA